MMHAPLLPIRVSQRLTFCYESSRHALRDTMLISTQFAAETVKRMARTQIVVESWRGLRDLCQLRDCFYRNSDSKLRRSGCDLVLAWEAFGRTPHAVTATAELTNALLGAQDGSVSVLTRANTFCTAWVRFVSTHAFATLQANT